jgi:WD40 repeat protein
MRSPWWPIAVAFLVVAAEADDAKPPNAPPTQRKIERKLPASVRSLSSSPDGKWLAACSIDPTASPVLFSTDDARRVEPFKEGAAPLRIDQERDYGDVLFTSDGRYIVALAADLPKGRDPAVIRARWNGAFALHVVDLTKLAVVRTIQVPATEDAFGPGLRDTAEGVSVEPGGSIVRVRRALTCELWDCGSGEMTKRTEDKHGVPSKTYSRDGCSTACSSLESLAAFDAKSGVRSWQVELPGTSPYKGRKFDAVAMFRGVQFSPDGDEIVAIASWNETNLINGVPTPLNHPRNVTRVEAYDARNGKLRWKHDVAEPLTPADLCTASGVVAIVDSLKIDWIDLQTGKVRGTTSGGHEYTCVAATEDGKTVWAGTKDGQILETTIPAPPR